MHRRYLRSALLVATVGACGDPTGPSGSFDLVVAGTESGRVQFLDTGAGRVVGVASFTLGPIAAATIASDGSTAYVTTINPTGRELMAIDLSQRAITWRLPMADVSHAVTYSGVQVSGDPIAIAADDHSLIVGNCVRGDSVGAALFDPRTRSVTSFRAPLALSGLGAFSTPALTVGFVLTGRRSDGLVSSSLVAFVPNSLQTLDSIAPAPPYQDPIQISPAPDGDRLYMGNYTSIYSYSRSQHRVIASTGRVAFGGMAVSPDGELVVVGDEGVWPDSPGSGKVYVYDNNMVLRNTIDLRSASLDGLPVVTHQLLFSRDGKWLFVGAGTASRGPTFPSQRAQVLIIDAKTLQLSKAIPLNDWGIPQLLPVH